MDSIDVSENTTVYALCGVDSNGNGKWDNEETPLTLAFEKGLYHGATVPDSQNILPGGSLPTITNPTGNAVYQFAGWQCGDTTYENILAYNKGKMPDHAVTMTALWTKKLQVAYVDQNGNAVKETKTVTVLAAENSYTARPETIANYDLVSDNTPQIYTFTGDEEELPTITWKYKPSDKHYTLTFDANGGSNGPAAVDVTVTGGTDKTTYTLPSVGDMTKQGYIFLGWTTTQHNDLTATDDKPDTVTTIDVSGNKTVYALWGVTSGGGTWDGDKTKRTLTFAAGDYKSASVPTAQDILPGGKPESFIDPTGNDVYTFKGWKYSTGSTTYASVPDFNNGKMPDANVTLTAQWEKKLQVVYQAGTPETQTVTLPAGQRSYTAEAKNIAGYTFVSAAPSTRKYTFTGSEETVPTITFTYRKVSSSSGGSSGGTAAKTEITTNPDGTITITPPKNAGKTTVEIPVQDVTPGTVAILVKPDGTEEILKDALPTENGIELTVEGTVTVKIVDNAKPFTDIQGHWAKDAIDFVSARGLVSGMTETTFAPNAPSTRAQLWTILARQAGADLTGGSTWYEKAQAWAMHSGISDGSDPNGNITRAQMVTMLWRAAGSPAVSGGSTAFMDVPEDSYYTQAVAWAAANGITTGVGDGKFDPNGTCTRAQIATFLYRTYVNRT